MSMQLAFTRNHVSWGKHYCSRALAIAVAERLHRSLQRRQRWTFKWRPDEWIARRAARFSLAIAVATPP